MFIFLPTLGWAMPALAPLAVAAAAALGYRHLSDPDSPLRGKTTRMLQNTRLETLPLDRILTEVVSEELGDEQRMVFEREDLRLVFRKDARGRFFIDVLGPREATADALRLRGEEFARALVQKFAYHRLHTQLPRTGAEVVSETVDAAGRITLRLRKWK